MIRDEDITQALVETVARYVRERLVPLEHQVADEDRIPPEVVQEMREMGLFGLTVPAGTLVRLAPREHVAHVWLPWREAADRCFSPSNAEAVLMLPRFLTS